MPNLIYFYLIGLASTVVVPVVAFVAYLTAHARGQEYERLRRRLPEATRYEDLQMRLADLQMQHDDMATEISAAHQTIDEADRQRKWLEEHRQEIEQMRVEAEELERHRLKYDQVVSELAEKEQHLEELTRMLKANEFDLSQKQKRIEEEDKRFGDLQRQSERATTELDAVRQRTEAAEAGLKEAREAELQAKEGAAVAKAEEAALRERVSDLVSRKEQLEAEVKGLEMRARQAAEAECSAEVRVKGLERQFADTTKRLKDMRDELVKIGGAVRTDEEALEELWKPAVNAEGFPEGAASLANERECLIAAERYLKDLALVFPQRTVWAFHTALKVADQTPLLVLAGISGTGKSLLPRRYAEAMGIHFLNVPVQPRWDGPQDLVGFFNYLENRYKATDLLRALLQFDPYCKQWAPKDYEHFLDERMLLVLLDEMNLARVEYYFSEFLSRLEIRRDIDADHAADRSMASLTLDLGEVGSADSREVFVDTNVMFVGTMNEDESTMTLSDKVVDRAALIRFGRPRDLHVGEEPRYPERSRTYLPRKHWNRWINDGLKRQDSEITRESVTRLNDALARVGRPFGYRTRDAMLSYVKQYPDQSEAGLKNAVADQIEQRIMPKLRGLDATEDAAVEAIQAVLNLAEDLGDGQLVEAIEHARSGAAGHLFQWMGVPRTVED